MSPVHVGTLVAVGCIICFGAIIAAWLLADLVAGKVAARTNDNFAASLFGGLVVWSAFIGGFVAAGMWLSRLKL